MESKRKKASKSIGNSYVAVQGPKLEAKIKNVKPRISNQIRMVKCHSSIISKGYTSDNFKTLDIVGKCKQHFFSYVKLNIL